MKNEFIYRNPIFISEVKKRLAFKRNYKQKTRLIMIDKFPIEKEDSKISSLLSPGNISQSNFNYFMNFIKEKGYKSAFAKVDNSNQNNLNKNKSVNIKAKKIKLINHINNIPNIIKLYYKSNNHQKGFYYKINIKKHNINNQNQTPFQINHIKNNFFKQYIKFSKEKSLHSNIQNEKNIESFSINSSGTKIKIFGKNKSLIRSLSENQTMKTKKRGNDFRISNINRNCVMNKKYYTIKPNCYYNRLNLRKFRLKPDKTDKIKKKDEK